MPDTTRTDHHRTGDTADMARYHYVDNIDAPPGHAAINAAYDCCADDCTREHANILTDAELTAVYERGWNDAYRDAAAATVNRR